MLRSKALRFAAQCTGSFDSMTRTGVVEVLCCPHCHARRSKSSAMTVCDCALGPLQVVKTKLEKALVEGRAAVDEFHAKQVAIARVAKRLHDARTELLAVRDLLRQSAQDEWGVSSELLARHDFTLNRDRATGGRDVSMSHCAYSLYDPDASVGLECPECGLKGNGSKQRRIWQLPDVALFQINRFEYSRDGKIATPVHLDPTLDLGRKALRGCVDSPHVPAPLSSARMVVEALSYVQDSPEEGELCSRLLDEASESID